MSRKSPKIIVLVCAAVVMITSGCRKSTSQDGTEENLISQGATIEVSPTVAPTPIPVTPAPGVTITPTVTPKVEEKEEEDINSVPSIEITEDNTEPISEGKSVITIEEAKQILFSVSKEELGLKNELKDYLISADDWTTVAGTDVCFCFNVYEQSESQPLIACFYVSTDGKKILRMNEESGDFEVIKSFE